MTPSPAPVDTFPADVLRVVLATPLPNVSLPPGRREEWEARVIRLLTRAPDRNAYESAFDELIGSAPLPPGVAESLYELELPADQIVRRGLRVLSDAEFVALAARPEAVQVLAELIMEGADEPDAWPEWRRLLAEADTVQPDEVRPELVAKLTEVARTHPSYANDRRSEPRPPRAFRLSPVWAALAASVLIAVGFLGGRLSRPAGREVALAGSFSAAREPDRGGAGFRTVVRVENRSDRRAFCTVVGLKGARSPVEFEEKGRYIELAPGETRAIELPPARFAGITDAVVVLTAAPAGEPLQRAVEASALPADPAAARDRLAGDLARLGFTGPAVELVRVPAADR
jgi:hypothetical protein